MTSGNIKIAFSSPSFVGTPNFMLVACLFGPENNAIYREQPCSNRCHLYFSDVCTPTIDYLKMKLYRT